MRTRILTLLIFAVTTTLLAQQTPRDLFERARLIEESNQNLAQAIGLYTQAAAEATARGQRELAATAQLRVALLHERLGNKADAERAFRTVVAQYADQPEVARQARARLPEATSSSSPRSFGTRRVWEGPAFAPLGTPSPDGRYLSFTDWNDDGKLALRDLVAGTTRHLTPGSSTSGVIVYGSLISPDGKAVVFNALATDGPGIMQFVHLDTLKQELLYRNDQLGYFLPFDWSRDGRYVLVLFNRLDGTNQIALVSVPDGSARILKTLDWRAPVGMSFSPDGRWIVYDFRPKEDAREHDLFVLATDGSRETRIVDHPADDVVLGWAPNGRTVLFASDRTGSDAFWTIEVVDGRAVGAPELLRAGVGPRLVPLGFSRAGAFYYFTFNSMSDVYTAEIDLASGRAVSPPAPVAGRFVGANESADWSPDGRALAIVRQPPGPGPKQILIQSPDGREARELRLDLTPVNWPRWSSDGKSILVSARDRRNRRGFFRVDTVTSVATPLLSQSPLRSLRLRADWSGDGKTLSLFYASTDENCTCVMRREIATGADTELYRMPRHRRQVTVAPSPDGRQVAVLSYDEAKQRPFLAVVNATGGGARVLIDGGELAWFSLLAWTPDSREVLFGRHSSGKVAVWRIAVTGGEPKPLELAMEGLRDLRVSPDGRRVVFTGGVNRGDVWVMNFVPAAAAARLRRE